MELIQYAGLWLLLALAFNMWAWLSVMRSGSGLAVKLIWTIVLVSLPIFAFIAWYLVGPREERV
jgi:hypothetical protein